MIREQKSTNSISSSASFSHQVGERAYRRRVTGYVFVLAFVFYVLGDFTSTYLAISAGAVEMNVVSRYFIHTYGFSGWFAAKVVELCVYTLVWQGSESAIDRVDLEQSSWLRTLAVGSIVGFPVGLVGVGVYFTANNLIMFYTLGGLG